MEANLVPPPFNTTTHGVWDPVAAAGTADIGGQFTAGDTQQLYLDDTVVATAPISSGPMRIPPHLADTRGRWSLTAVDSTCGCESRQSQAVFIWKPTAPAPAVAPAPPTTVNASPTNVTATAEWNGDSARIKLEWSGKNYFYKVIRDGALMVDGIWSHRWFDANPVPGKTHVYQVIGTGGANLDSLPSAPASAMAVAGPPIGGGTVPIVSIVGNIDSCVINFGAVPGAVDYWCYNPKTPEHKKCSGGGLSIEMNGIDPANPGALVVEALDKLGPFMRMDGTMGIGTMGMDGKSYTYINGQGDPSNEPNVVASSKSFAAVIAPRTLTGLHSFLDSFQTASPFVVQPRVDPRIWAKQGPGRPNDANNPYIRELRNDNWLARLYQTDMKRTKVFPMGLHLMATVFDNDGVANASCVFSPIQAIPGLTPGQVLHIPFECDSHVGSRRWFDLLIARDSAALQQPGKSAAASQSTWITDDGLALAIEVRGDKIHVLSYIAGYGYAILPDIDAVTAGKPVWGDRGKVVPGWPVAPGANGTRKMLDLRHRFDVYTDGKRVQVWENGICMADADMTRQYNVVNGNIDAAGPKPNDRSCPWITSGVPLRAYYIHEVYHTSLERDELLGDPDNAYWYDQRPSSDERHWDNMGSEVLTSFGPPVLTAPVPPTYIDDLAARIAAAEAAVASAQAAADAANSTLRARTGRVAMDNQDVASAQAAITAAQDAIAAAQAALTTNQAALAAAQATLTTDQAALATAQGTVDAANAALTSAQAALAALKAT